MVPCHVNWINEWLFQNWFAYLWYYLWLILINLFILIFWGLRAFVLICWKSLPHLEHLKRVEHFTDYCMQWNINEMNEMKHATCCVIRYYDDDDQIQAKPLNLLNLDLFTNIQRIYSELFGSMALKATLQECQCWDLSV